jgi:putative peptide zinc metalloprotease protein
MNKRRSSVLVAIAAIALVVASAVQFEPARQAGAQATSTSTPVATSTPDPGTPAATSAPVVTATPLTTATSAPDAATATATSTPVATTLAATPAATAAPAPFATATAAPAATGSSGDEQSGSTYNEELPGGGGHNAVSANNRVDNRLLVRGSVKLDHIPGPNASPVNEASAFASCTGCQTFSVALQVALISKTATSITPQNLAAAVNYQCSNCVTVARAVQYVVQVDDPTQVPDDVRDLVKQMQDQLQGLSQDRSVTQADQAEAVINSVMAQFSELGQSLYDQRQEETQPTTPGAGG